ncbi:AfsR/SARP family transcriptional regulator [Streptomyces sp. NPDC004232]|uniref:AfsR/SARP family transcriptional regulator n=1 Tax=Streptomyces sp. NPDC004232 TaxID=3154454 RepID=UPI001D1CBFCF|nr:AfsR/SARP family transcriptional regulator [Streptomyces sp. tea 10]
MALFRMLGPFEVEPRLSADRITEPRGPKVRKLLSLFLLNPGTIVTLHQMMDELWGEDVVDSAVPTVRTHVYHLRRALAGRRADGSGAMIHTSSSGYVLDLRGDSTDVLAFRESASRGGDLLKVRDYAAAARELRHALSQWRGPALADVSHGRILEQEAAHLEDQRQDVLHQWITAELQLGNHTGIIGELRRLVAVQPLNEWLYGCLIESLYHSGRRHEALHVYRQIRDALGTELGLEPAPFLQEMQQLILSPATGTAPRPGSLMSRTFSTTA